MFGLSVKSCAEELAFDQLLKTDADRGRGHWGKAGCGHSWNCIDFKEPRGSVFINNEVGTGDSTQTELIIGFLGL